MKNRPHLIPAVISSVMLLAAIGPLPDRYYEFLRVTISGVAIFMAIKSYFWRHEWAVWVFGAVAILFDPFIPIYLSKSVWQMVDLTSALVFGLSIFLIHEQTSDNKTKPMFVERMKYILCGLMILLCIAGGLLVYKANHEYPQGQAHFVGTEDSYLDPSPADNPDWVRYAQDNTGGLMMFYLASVLFISYVLSPKNSSH